MEKIADDVYRLGTKWVNFYLVAEGDALTLIDTGLPGYVTLAHEALSELGRSPSDVKAIVLTHTHPDHIGGADVLAKETGAPVLVPRGEAARATGAEKPVNAKGFKSNLWRPHLLSFVAHAVANKGSTQVTLDNVVPYADDDVLDVPGKPRVVHTPGHSPAHSALLLESSRSLVCGDAMATLGVHDGSTGPMIHPFAEDRAAAIRSLEILERVDADVLLPGHGEPWRGRVADAVAEARRRLR